MNHPKHAGKRLFITGIPTAGKSHLSKMLAEKVGGIAVNLDDLRESLSADARYKKWVEFYLDQDEKKYLTETSADDQWKNLAAQSEALWPAFAEKISSYESETRPIIFECVNLLPHLAKKDFDFPGVAIIGESFEKTLERNKLSPRWGNTLELQTLEAKSFFTVERPRYTEEADRHGWPTFKNAEDAVNDCMKVLS